MSEIIRSIGRYWKKRIDGSKRTATQMQGAVIGSAR